MSEGDYIIAIVVLLFMCGIFGSILWPDVKVPEVKNPIRRNRR